MNQNSAHEDLTPRRRGRPKGSTAGATRRKILKAATEEFAHIGFEAASLRSVARRAGVDASLVHHYFTNKTELFLESLNLPINPADLVRQALAHPTEQLGEALVRAVVSSWANPLIRPAATALLRSIVSSQTVAKMIRPFLQKEMLTRLGSVLPAEDAERRVSLAASQIIGLIMGRYIVQIEPLASMSDEEVIASVGPVVQWYLTSTPPLKNVDS